MQEDIRATVFYRESETLHTMLRQPGTGQISDAADVHASPDAKYAVFSGTIVEEFRGSPVTRICQVDLHSGDTRVLTFGPRVDRFPKYSPDGKQVAFLSDRAEPGNFQLYLLDPTIGAVRPTPIVDGWVEYLQWSPDGNRILMGVAGHGADVSGGQGAVTSKGVARQDIAWAPMIDSGDEAYRWRRLWVYELPAGIVRQLSAANDCIWEAVWCGNQSVAAVVSHGPGEGLWYSAHLRVVEAISGVGVAIYTPQDQISVQASSPSGHSVAIVEGICSDRGIVAGQLRWVAVSSGSIHQASNLGMDVSYVEWRSEEQLLIAGHRGMETVVGLYNTEAESFTELWCSSDISTGGRYVTIAGVKDSNDCVLVGEGFQRAPEIALIRRGQYHPLKSFDPGHLASSEVIRAIDQVRWTASDGLVIEGWLLQPGVGSPNPMIMMVHGGPVWHYRSTWLGRVPVVLLLLMRGYAIFLPNPRGSSGRGRNFTSQVQGDMGGADALDCLAGLDYLVHQGLADPTRLGITGTSYGGFMTAWLITQDSRFAAAVAVAPITNHVTQHLISNIPHFVSLFLADSYSNPAGKYFQRSPVMHASNVKTPTLNICGALDRCTPPEEARQFHNALLEHGATSVLVTYPEEGHGIKKMPAVIDYSARVVFWFDQHMPVHDGLAIANAAG